MTNDSSLHRDEGSRRVPHVTVVLAVYGRPELLDVVVRSLNEQDYESAWELIICDDGTSVDMRQAVAALVDCRRLHLEYVWQQHSEFRVARSRNNGLRLARAPIVICLDGDVVVPRDFVRSHVARHTHPKMVVCGTRYWLPAAEASSDMAEQVQAVFSNHGAAARPTLPSDLTGQARYVGTSWPWLSCISCNFSFTKSADALFDEEFVGWGFEDDDFAYRLYADYGYQVVLAPELWGVHIDGGPQRNSPVRPSTTREIELFLRNLVRFASKHGVDAVAPALTCIGMYEFDEASQTWTVAPTPDYSPSRVQRLTDAAIRWSNSSAALRHSELR